MARSLLHAAGEPFSISNAGFAIIRGQYFFSSFFCHLSLAAPSSLFIISPFMCLNNCWCSFFLLHRS